MHRFTARCARPSLAARDSPVGFVGSWSGQRAWSSIQESAPWLYADLDAVAVREPVDDHPVSKLEVLVVDRALDVEPREVAHQRMEEDLTFTTIEVFVDLGAKLR